MSIDEKPEMGTKVLIANIAFPSHGGTRVDKFVKYLPRFGVEPIVVAAREYNRFHLKNMELTPYPDWLEVHQCSSLVPAFFSHLYANRKPGGRHYTLLKLLSLPERCVFVPDYWVRWIPSAIRASREIVSRGGLSAVLTSSPYESTHLIGLALKRRFGIRWIVDFRDLWTAKKLAYRPATPLHDWYIRRLERTIMAEADHVIANTDENKAYYLREFGCADHAVTVIPNGFDRDDLPTGPPEYPDDGVFRIGHMGLLNKTAYPWELIFLAVNRLATEVGRDKVRFIHCGTFAREVQDFVRANGMQDVLVWEGMLPHGRAMQKIAATNAQVVLLYDTEDGKTLAPMKLYNYLVMQGPIIALAPEDGAVARIIRQTRAGEVVSPKRGVDAVYALVRRYYDDFVAGRPSVTPDENGIRLYDREYHAQLLAALLAQGESSAHQ